MGLIGFLFISGLLMLTLLLTLGGYVLQRDRYWKRIWENMGKPDVKDIKELKNYINNQTNSVMSGKFGTNYIEPK